MKQHTIAFLGGGNMARSLIGGLIANGIDPDRLRVADPHAEAREALAASFAVHTSEDNSQALIGADVVVLAIKPQVVRRVAEQIAEAVGQSRPLIISIVAGIRTPDIDRWLGGGHAIVRCMPNTPALVRSGMTGLFANPVVSKAQRDTAESILRAVGATLWVDGEAALDAVTAVSGSGPAYFFLFAEALEAAAQELGLEAEAARLLSLQTAFGAAKLALESSETVGELRRRVTSPGGTTERAVAELESGDLKGLVQRAARAAEQRARELADELGGA
jgi:pyrroline-5-carboxylate reductase